MLTETAEIAIEIVSKLSSLPTQYTSGKISSVLLTRAQFTTMKQAGHYGDLKSLERTTLGY